MKETNDDRGVPPVPRWLGAAGLMPQIAAVVLLAASDDVGLRAAATLAAGAYAALILSFLGGLWWGLAATRPAAPRWIYAVAVVPSLIGFGAALSLAAIDAGAAMIVLGGAILSTLAIDRRLVAIGVAPRWWLGLRVPLSVGLGVLTIAAGLLA